MHVRDATAGDMDAIVAMSERFYATTEYPAIAPFCAESVRGLAEGLADAGIMLVAEHDGEVVGMAGLAVAPFLFNRATLAAYEVVWWVNPGVRAGGTGLALLAEIERSARAKGCKAIQMVSLATSPPHVGRVYQRCGYRHSETSYTKVL